MESSYKALCLCKFGFACVKENEVKRGGGGGGGGEPSSRLSEFSKHMDRVKKNFICCSSRKVGFGQNSEILAFFCVEVCQPISVLT